MQCIFTISQQYTIYNVRGDVVMKATEGGKSSASLQPLRTQGAVCGAELV